MCLEVFIKKSTSVTAWTSPSWLCSQPVLPSLSPGRRQCCVVPGICSLTPPCPQSLPSPSGWFWDGKEATLPGANSRADTPTTGQSGLSTSCVPLGCQCWSGEGPNKAGWPSVPGLWLLLQPFTLIPWILVESIQTSTFSQSSTSSLVDGITNHFTEKTWATKPGCQNFCPLWHCCPEIFPFLPLLRCKGL